MASLRELPDRKRKYLVRWKIKIRFGPKKGTYYQGSKAFLKKEDAEALVSVLDAQTDRIAIGDMPQDFSTRAAVEKWKVHLRNNYTTETRRLYKDYVEKFIRALPKECITLGQITTSTIEDYLERMAEKVSSRTVNSHLAVIRSFLKWAAKKYNIADNPVNGIKDRNEKKPKPRFLTELEYRKVCACAQGDTLDWILFIANSGLRVSEFIALTWQDISPGQSSIHFVGKGGRPRTVPLNPICKDVLQRQMQHQNKSTHIFLSKSHKPLKRRNLNTRFRLISVKANIPNFGPHSLRHYFATQLLLRGVRIQLVSKLLGHRSIKTTEDVYIHILPEDLIGTTDILASE